MKNFLKKLFFKRAFEGASKKKRMSAWTPLNNGINKELTDGVQSTLRARARDLVVNNPYAKMALSIWCANVVGSGIKPFLKNNTIYEQKLKRWMENPKLCDVTGELNYYQMQDLIFRSIVRDGAVIIRRKVSRDNFQAGEIPTQLQILEVDHLATNQYGVSGEIVQGQKVDENGKTISYFIYKKHPGENIFYTGNDIIEIPAEEIIFPREILRAGQKNGYTWFSSVILKLRGIDEYEDAELMRQKIAACMAGFIEKNEALGGVLGQEDDETDLPERITPGTIEVLRPGEKITFSDPPSKEGYDSFMKQNLRAVAVGCEVPYVLLADDLSDVNYSSYRGGLLQFFRRVKAKQDNLMIPVCKKIIGWTKEDAQKLGGMPGSDEDIEHIPQKRDIIDPSKEVPSIIDGIRAGLFTLSESILEQGKDPDSHFETLKNDKEKIDSLGLILDSDASVTQKNGANKQDENTKSNSKTDSK